MYIRNWKTQIFTIPNALSMLRILLIPVYIYFYWNATQPRDYYWAGAILAISCLTDALDGIIARKFHMISSFGKILDPIADKTTQLTLTLCLSLKFPVLIPVLTGLVIKELCQIIGTLLLVRRGTAIPSAMLPGKICTAVLFISLITLVLFPNAPDIVVNTISIVDSAFLMLAFVGYYFTFWRHRS